MLLQVAEEEESEIATKNLLLHCATPEWQRARWQLMSGIASVDNCGRIYAFAANRLALQQVSWVLYFKIEACVTSTSMYFVSQDTQNMF